MSMIRVTMAILAWMVLPVVSFGAVIKVGPAVQVTTAHSDLPQWEATICANPINPLELAVGAMYDRPAADYVHDVAFYTSRDGGKTWTLRLDNKHRADPSCTFASDGTLYSADMSALPLERC